MKWLLALPALTLILACGKHEIAQAPVLPSMRVKLISAQGGTGEGWVAATLTATQRAVLSTRMAASVRKIHVTEGQHVGEGALLISLADDDLQGGLKAAEAGLASAGAHFRRIQALFAQNASTSSELEMAQTQKAQAEAGSRVA